MNNLKPKVVAEIGCNHCGSVSLAERLIEAASRCYVDVVKFQKRNPKELLTEEQYNSPHPNPKHSYGNTYGEHREFLEFDLKTHVHLSKVCEENNVTYSTSVWDLTSAKEIIDNIHPSMVKIPSACNNNYKLIDYILDKSSCELHISLGMNNGKDTYKLMNYLSQKRYSVVYACTSGYPVPPKNVHLLEIEKIKHRLPAACIGFSGHHLGTNIDMAAFALGASWIERHFTLDKNMKGSDHAASLNEGQMRNLVLDLYEIYLANTYKPENMEHIEKEQFDKLKYRGG